MSDGCSVDGLGESEAAMAMAYVDGLRTGSAVTERKMQGEMEELEGRISRLEHLLETREEIDG